MSENQNLNLNSRKILVVHNRYRSIGGEDIAVEKEIQFLKKFNDVKVLKFENNITNYFLQFIYFLTNNNKKVLNILKTF